MDSDHLVLPGSGHPSGEGWLRRGPAPADLPLGVTIYLREQPGRRLATRVAALRTADPCRRDHLSYRELAARHGPSAADLEAIRLLARRHDLTVGARNGVACSVEVSGRAADLARAFGVELQSYVNPHALAGGRMALHVGHAGPVQVPAELAGRVLAVAGLSDRPLARAHFMVEAPQPVAADAGASAREVAAAYGVPADASAAGRTVGIIALGGGYTRQDIEVYCRHPSVDVVPPAITDISIHGATNTPTNGGDIGTADGEVALDIQTVAAVARGADIRVYFAPNTDRGFIDAVARAAAERCSVISISWGAPEALWPFSSMIAFDRTCQAALTLGTPVLSASGDNGSTDGLFGARSNADFPASCPHVVGCGGTRLPELDLRRETAWNDLAAGGGAGGGAVSDAWPLPDFQEAAHPPLSVNDGRLRRTVPDLAANAAPGCGYRVVVGGRWYVIGGTSAAAPLISGMVALMDSEVARRRPGARLGDFNSVLYSRFAPGGALHDIADGSTNGGQYVARPGYDAVTGWGSPDYARMLELCLAARAATPPGLSR